MALLKKCFKIILATLLLYSVYIAFSSDPVGAMSLFKKPTDEVDILKHFKKENILIGQIPLNVYLAKTDIEHSQGLMFVESLPENSGMLFIFDDVIVRGFWMKNTKINLDIGYFDGNGSLIDVQTMTAGYGLQEFQLKSYVSRGPAKYALEMNEGWFSKNGIQIGTNLQIGISKVQQ